MQTLGASSVFYLKAQLSSRKELLVGLISLPISLSDEQNCAVGSGSCWKEQAVTNTMEKRVFFTVIVSLKFIFLVTSSIHVLACLLTGLRNILGRNCSWKFSSMSCLGSQACRADTG